LQWLKKFNGDACVLVPDLLVRFCGLFLRRFQELFQNWNSHLFFLILFGNLLFLFNSSILLSVQVFDGHGGKHAADFACYHLPKFIVEDENFPKDIERIVASAFSQTDTAFADACSLDEALASGTTALAALVIGGLGVLYPPNIKTNFSLFHNNLYHL